MTSRTSSISNEVLTRFPEYVRGVVIAYDLKNGDSSPELVELFRAAEASVRERLNLEYLTSHPRIRSFPSSVERADDCPFHGLTVG